MGTDCQESRTYGWNDGVDLTIEYLPKDEEIRCRCCWNKIKTTTAYYLQMWYNKEGSEIKGKHSWYCHKCFKVIMKAHKKAPTSKKEV